MAQKPINYFGTTFDSAGHYFFQITDRFQKCKTDFESIPFCPETMGKGIAEETGEAVYRYIGSYNILFICGSVADSRRGSKSVFWLEGEILGTQAMLETVTKNPICSKIVNTLGCMFVEHKE